MMTAMFRLVTHPNRRFVFDIFKKTHVLINIMCDDDADIFFIEYFF
jgi:hypothetical protein